MAPEDGLTEGVTPGTGEFTGWVIARTGGDRDARTYAEGEASGMSCAQRRTSLRIQGPGCAAPVEGLLHDDITYRRHRRHPGPGRARHRTGDLGPAAAQAAHRHRDVRCAPALLRRQRDGPPAVPGDRP